MGRVVALSPDRVAPGLLIACCAGLFAGVLPLVAGAPVAWAVTTGVLLALPLALLGIGYGALRAHGVLRGGAFAPVALFWVIGFPLARLVQDVGTRLVLDGGFALPPSPLGFLAYQAMLSIGFAIGFVWVHERLTGVGHAWSARRSS
ncbi:MULTISPECIES: hypothetical protein [Saccharopolyspora]|uniref:Apolipoprotein N-acyltransferase n=1 Tax=Saccharopolyspora cebuensis TaxID=418759 RepID=A0ABV4CEL4_9PSEU